MKLIKCYVSSFGGIKDFTYDFSSELNEIKQDNGWGKSTLATFIKAMFYGLDGANKRSLLENERKKYKPWNSTETFGGYVHFEWGNNEYIIERYFGNKESEDTVKLTDAKTGKSFSNTQNLGRRIFEIDEEGFLSTTYFSQKDFEIKSNTSLTAKFNEMCGSENSDAFDKALSKIEQKIKTYKYSGDRGLIPDARRELYSINDEIERANLSAQTVVSLEKEALLLEDKGKQIQRLTEQLTNRVEIAGKAESLRDKKQRYEKLVAEKEKLLDNKKSAEEVLNGNQLSELEISPYEHKAREIDVLSEKIISINSDISLLEQSEQSDNANGNDNVFTVIFGVFGAIGLILATVFAVLQGLSSVITWVGVAVFIFSILGLCGNYANKKNKNQKQPFSAITISKKEELGKCLSLKNQYQEEVDEFINGFSLGESYDRITALSYIKRISEVYKVICADIEKLDEQINEYSQIKDQFNSDEISNENLAVLNVELRRAQDEYTRNSIELAQKRSSIKIHKENAYKLIDLENAKTSVNEKIKQLENELHILTLTKEHLKNADENLKAKYRQPLLDSLNKCLALIDGKANANIDLDLTVTIKEKGGEKSTEYYSKGYQNLFEICKRFALTDVLFKGEKPFIILDDPFFNLDDKKVDGALDLIKNLAKEYQIIYFVCHESRSINEIKA